MSNREEFDKILKIVGTDEYPEDKGFINGTVRRFRILRNLMYVLVFGMAFIIFQDDRIIYINPAFRLAFCWVTVIILYIYLILRRKLHKEINSCLFRECRPDIGISRYLGFVSKMIHGELLWSAIQYNFGCGFYRLGRIEQSAKCLALMQESCNTAGEMLMAEQLKSLIAQYYNDYDTVMSCANEAAVLYPKVRHTEWNSKIYNDIQKAAAYAQCCKAGNFGQIYTVLQAPEMRPMDEVTRVYYLYCTAKELQDFETAEKYRVYVRLNAGTTWYGRAVEDGFIPERKPDNYPGFAVSPERLNKPAAVNKKRLMYTLISVGILILFYLVPRLIVR